MLYWSQSRAPAVTVSWSSHDLSASRHPEPSSLSACRASPGGPWPRLWARPSPAADAETPSEHWLMLTSLRCPPTSSDITQHFDDSNKIQIKKLSYILHVFVWTNMRQYEIIILKLVWSRFCFLKFWSISIQFFKKNCNLDFNVDYFVTNISKFLITAQHYNIESA